jgi:hypothetical protein
MRYEKIKVYEFNELSEEAKEKAIEKLWNINVDYEWWDCVYDDAENIGLKIKEFDLDRGSYVKGEFTISAQEVASNIIRDHGESCETYQTAVNFINEYEPVFSDYMNEQSENFESGELEDKMLDMESEFLKSLCEDYRIMLQREYEWRTSTDEIIKTIDANGYEFTKDGKLF